MGPDRSYRIVARYFDKSWQTITLDWFGSYEGAARVATGVAKELDRLYGNSQFWNVFLRNPETGDDYYEFFHGRVE